MDIKNAMLDEQTDIFYKFLRRNVDCPNVDQGLKIDFNNYRGRPIIFKKNEGSVVQNAPMYGTNNTAPIYMLNDRTPEQPYLIPLLKVRQLYLFRSNHGGEFFRSIFSEVVRTSDSEAWVRKLFVKSK